MSSSARPPITTVRVHARGEDFRVVQLAGSLFVCSKEGGSCCCGHDAKGRMPFDHTLWADEWERRRLRSRLHLTFSGCLGPCIAGNNALLVLHGQSIWLCDLNDATLPALVFDYIEAMLAAGEALPPPPALARHVYTRYQPTPGCAPFLATTGDSGGLERLDPVCLMDVDPVTARYTTLYRGRTIAFCAPGCKRAFEREPEAYVRE